MPECERSVLHVLPHAGGGGETYVDMLSGMAQYRFTRVELAPSRNPSLGSLRCGIVEVARRVRSHDLLHVHEEAASALFLPLLAARPSVVTLHGLHLLRRSTGLRNRAAALTLHAIVRRRSHNLCLGHRIRRAHRCRRRNCRTPGCRRPERRPSSGGSRRRRTAAVREEFGLSPSDPVAIWVGSLDERRDPVTVIRAAARSSIPLLVAGDGRLRGAAEQAADAYVRLLGQRGDVPRLLAAADFFVLMSHREGLSFALLEAMAHGLPAIVADVAENVEAIGNSGLAVPYGDEEALAAAMRRLATDGQERAELGAPARRRVAQHFAADEMIARTRAVYDEVLTERNLEGVCKSRPV